MDYKQADYRAGFKIIDKTNTTNFDVNSYGLMDNTGNQFVFNAMNSSGSAIFSKTASYSNPYNTYHHLKIVKEGTSISAYIDSVLIGSDTEFGGISIANIGMYTWRQINSSIKNLKIKPL